MAKLENESSNSSSAEEQELSSDSSGSESEPDKTSTPPPSSSKKPQLTSEESETDSDESETEKTIQTNEKSLVPYPTIKPISSKPMEVVDSDAGENSKKSRPKNPTSRYSPPIATGKRSSAAAEAADGGRMRKKTVVAVAAPDAVAAEEINNNGGGGDKKQLLFQRLWSEGNEIELIQAMISYVEIKGKDPMADINDFYEFAKKTLNVNVTIRQMITKVRRLKKKFENNVAKVEKNGRVRSFSNPHEKEMYELSKILWGSDGDNNGVMSSKGKKVNVTPKISKNRKVSKGEGSGNGNNGNGNNNNGGTEVSEVTPIEVEPRRVVQSVPVASGNVIDYLGLIGMPVTDDTIMRKAIELSTVEKRAEFEQKLKNLKVLELKNFVEKVKLLKEQAEVVLSAIENAGAN